MHSGRFFFNGKFAGSFLSVLRSLLLSPCQLSKDWLSFPDLWMCLISIPAPISQLLLKHCFEVWSIFSVSLVEPTKASKKTRRFAKAYRVRGSPQNHGLACRNSKLGNCSLVVLGSKVFCLSGESRAAPWIFFYMGRPCSLSCLWQWLRLCSVRIAQPEKSQAQHYTCCWTVPSFLSHPVIAHVPARRLNVYWTKQNGEKREEYFSDVVLP